jgi:ribosomal protein S12 methylthiotransferase accessory factor
MGFTARPTAELSASKALAEAYNLQLTCLALDDESRMHTRGPADVTDVLHLKPWRADRRYMDSYREDYADLVALICQQQFYLDARAGRRARGSIWTDQTREWDSLPSLPERSFGLLEKRVSGRGFEVISVDLTTTDVAAAGMHVTRIVVPGLVSNFAPRSPFLGARRLWEAPAALKWRSGEPCKHLNLFPMPYA